MTTYDMAMQLVEARLAAYDRVWDAALNGQPDRPYRPNGAYREGWTDAMGAVIDALRGETK